MADVNPGWVDQWLEKLLRQPQALPVVAVERSRAQQHRRLLWLIAGFVMVLAGALNGLIFCVGVKSIATIETLKMTLGLPLVLGVLLYLFLYFAFVRKRHAYNDHSWKFRATAEGLRVDCGDGRVYEAPWQRWRYESYTYSVARMRRGITGLDLSMDGQKVAIDLKRMGNGLALARAVIQQLVAHSKKLERIRTDGSAVARPSDPVNPLYS